MQSYPPPYPQYPPTPPFQRYPRLRRFLKSRLGIAIIAGAFICSLFSCIATFAASNSSSPTPTPTNQVIQTTATQLSTPTTKPTTKPTATPTPQPTKKPISTPVQQLAITFTLVDAGDVSVHTLPGAALTIKVLYCSGHYATSQSLQGTVKADIAGDYIWSWTVSTSCHGQATAYVTASLNGKTVSGSAHFTT